MLPTATTGEEGRHPMAGGPREAGRGEVGTWGGRRGNQAKMSSGSPENGVFVWGADKGQGGDCVGGPEVPH